MQTIQDDNEMAHYNEPNITKLLPPGFFIPNNNNKRKVTGEGKKLLSQSFPRKNCLTNSMIKYRTG